MSLESRNVSDTKYQITNSFRLDEVMDLIPVSWFHYRLLAMCGIAFMADAMEVSILSYLSTCAGDEWNLSDFQRATITSMVFGGEILGSFVWGGLADHYGRKYSFLVACFLISLGGFLSGVAPNYTWLLIFRAIVGFGIGGLTIPFDLLAEFLPLSHRGKYLIFIELFWTVGSLFVNGMAWAILSSYGWRVLTFIIAIPVTLSFIASIILLPESPRWLLIKGRNKEAEKILRDVAEICEYKLEPFALQSVQETGKEATIIELLSDHTVRKISILLAIVWMSFGFSYYGIILFVSRLYTTNNDDSGTCNFDYSMIFINSISEIFGVLLTMMIIDPLGRRYTQTYMYMAGGMLMLILGFRIPYAGVITVAWIARLFAMGSSSTTWVATPELFPTEMRATGHSICNSVARIGAFLSPYVVSSDINIFLVAIILFIVNSIAALASFSLPETSDQELDEVIRKSVSDSSSSSRSISQLLLNPVIITNPMQNENSSYKSV